MSVKGVPPLVSVGLPVYNGGNFIEQALRSILAQSFEDFELIISDNASTDNTAEICAAFAAQDRRIRYVRQQQNVGSAANFMATLQLARGQYFKWAAHDDEIRPDFLATSLAALRLQPDAVLSYSAAEVIDGEGDFVSCADDRLPVAEGDDPVARFAQVAIEAHECRAIFGLIRRDQLDACEPMRCYFAADKAMLADLALRGRYVYVPQPLLRIRDHPSRYVRTALINRNTINEWWGTDRSARFGLHYFRHLATYIQLVKDAPIGAADRLRCLGHVLAWCGHGKNQIGLAMDTLFLLDPRLAESVRWAKRRVLQAIHWPRRSAGAQPTAGAQPIVRQSSSA